MENEIAYPSDANGSRSASPVPKRRREPSPPRVRRPTHFGRGLVQPLIPPRTSSFVPGPWPGYSRPAPSPPPPPAPAVRNQEKYHWSNYLILRSDMAKAFEKLSDVHQDLLNGHSVRSDDLRDVLAVLHDRLSCAICGQYVPVADTHLFVARCGHVYCKNRPCFSSCRGSCVICQPAR